MNGKVKYSNSRSTNKNN